ncbi:MDR family MFS transporter [Arenibacterium halophilum]|uniref:MFS transporter n=1 Tax=Arenibacterium halophilum TaxID=2583821 RepID=A0ABY2XEZ0_9RHOB|nr:MDR family MFS transporter [Arenibacterium halophilum]TMV15152.1 MFS transporter [Arenibacterium halophilum]
MSSPTPPNATEPVDWSRIRLVFAAVAVTLFLASLGQTVVTTALPIIVGELGGLDQITWVITAYLLAATVGAPIFGKLGDLFGRKKVLQAGILVFLTGTTICALAPSIWVLVAGRAVQGMGGGGLIVVSMATIADVLPPRQRGRFQGILGSVFGLSTVIGPLAGGFIVQHFDWTWIFLMNLPIGAVVFVLLAVLLETPPARKRASLDYAGAIGLSLVLSLLVVMASLGGKTLAWDSAEMAFLMLGAVAALVGFVAAEKHSSEPILPLGLFGINNFVVSNSVGFITGVAMFSTITFVPFFLQVVKGVSPAMSGLYTFPMMIGLIGASTLSGQFMSRTGRYRILPVYSTLVLALAMVALGFVGPHTPNPVIGGLMFLAGVGIGPVMGVGVTAIQNSVPARMVGVGTASANMFRLIGGSLGTAAYGALFAAGLGRHLGTVMPGTDPRALSAQQIAAMPEATREVISQGIAHALHPVFWCSAALACVASCIALMMVERPLADTLPAAE